MSADRTFVTELATGLGMLAAALGDDVDGGELVARRPTQLANLGADGWERLDRLWAGGDFADDFAHGVANGRAFALAPDALNGRPPRIVEWTGPRRPPGDEVVPADLRVDHVYLVSCKYLSKVLHNASPTRLVEGLLAQGSAEERGDWYATVAPGEHHELYRACTAALGGSWPAAADTLDAEQRRALATALRGTWPDDAVEPYRHLCAAVASATAARWSARIDARTREALLWRLLRIGSAPYFVLGSSAAGPVRLRIDTPWDWRQRYALRGFEVEAQAGGQPRVAWRGRYRDLGTGADRVVEGHVELRWSHGRFSGPPEAKVYLDTPHDEVPGYHPLDADAAHGADGAPDTRVGVAPDADGPGAELTLFEA